MVTKNIKDEASISIEGPYSEIDLKKLEKYKKIETLRLTKQKNLTIKIASGLSSLQSLRQLFLWSSVNRTAMRHVIPIPDLEILDILALQHPGKLVNFSEAITLKEFRCNNYMTEADLFEVAKLPKVQEIGAQNASLSKQALVSLLKLPNLIKLDLEATEFSDKMATIMSKSNAIKELSIGASKLTSKGLEKISEMSQLESLDIWATDIYEKDLELLLKLPNLKYLSLGGYEDQTRLTSKGILPRLNDLTSLKSLWLDGVILSEAEKISLENKYEYFRN